LIAERHFVSEEKAIKVPEGRRLEVYTRKYESRSILNFCVMVET
jgi:hypothetical protein